MVRPGHMNYYIWLEVIIYERKKNYAQNQYGLKKEEKNIIDQAIDQEKWQEKKEWSVGR